MLRSVALMPINLSLGSGFGVASIWALLRGPAARAHIMHMPHICEIFLHMPQKIRKNSGAKAVLMSAVCRQEWLDLLLESLAHGIPLH